MKNDKKIRTQYPDFILWHEYYGEMLEKHPEFLKSSPLRQANEMHKFFYSSVKHQKRVLSRISENFVDNSSIIKKVYQMKNDKKINKSQEKYFYLSRDTEYDNVKMRPTWEDVKEYDYMEPVSRLSSYYGELSHYNKIIKLYADYYAGKVGRLDEQFAIDIIDPVDRDLIMLEYIKCRRNMNVLALWPIIVKKIENDRLIKILEKYGNICYTKTITLSKMGLFNLMFWTYKEMTFSSRIDFITKNMERLQLADENDVTIVFIDSPPENKINNDEIIQLLLEESGLKINDSIMKDDISYTIGKLHDVIEYGKMVLNDNSIRLLEIQDVNNISSNHFIEANLKLQTLKNWCGDNLSPLEENRILMYGDVVLYSSGFRNINDVNLFFVSVNNDDSQSEKELKEMLNINFMEKNTKFPFFNMKIEKSEYWNDEWSTEVNEILSYFDMDDLLEITTDPRYHYYFGGFKCMLFQQEIVRKIYSNTDKDKADFIMMTTLHPGMTSQFVQLKGDKLKFKTNDTEEILSHEHLKKLFKFIYKKYPRKDINRLKKILDDRMIMSD